MKKILLILSLIAAMGIGGSALASTASAASCVASMTPTWFDATYGLRFDAGLSCTGVNYVQFGDQLSGGNGTASGTGAWWDYTWGGNEFAYINNPTTVPYYSGTVYGSYYQGAWCYHQTHTVYTYFNFRIHSTGGTWGPWHQKSSNTYQIVC